MVDGKVRNFEGHFARLLEAVPAAEQFREPIKERLRTIEGSVFTWVSVEDHNFNVQTRPSRTFQHQFIMDAHGHRDERSQPKIKGIDAAWQSQVTALSRRQGADEGLLIDELGRVISAVDSSLLVLKGGMVFHSTHPRTLSSVLEEPVLRFLSEQGATAKARPEGFSMEGLRAAEVWMIDSFAGVRRVKAWLEYGNVLPVPEVRPVVPFMPTFAEANDCLWTHAEKI